MTVVFRGAKAGGGAGALDIGKTGDPGAALPLGNGLP